VRSRRLAIAAWVMAFGFGGVGAASALPIAGHVRVGAHLIRDSRVGDRAEAWYSTPSGSLCIPLVGCLPLPLPVALPPPLSFPAGTLHVGVTLGAESARAYVVPDLPSDVASLPPTGVLILPVDNSPLAGTLDLGSSRIKACLTTGRAPTQPTAKAASAGSPPSVDCTVSTPARYDAAIKAFRVDLTPFLAKWQHGRADHGIALLPGLAGASRLAEWQVAFDGRGSTSPTVYSLLANAGSGRPPTTPTPTPSSPPSIAASPPTITVPLPGVSGVEPPVAPPAIAPSAQAEVYLVRPTGFRYPAIFIAPLAILAGVVFFGRLFTGSSVRPRRTRMGAESSDG
jgi:hypothetical protein